ncbi:alpha-2-macroglobulin [Bacteroides sp. 519]|nr:MG2 domain-containing protein [Bacteroides sp. 519]NDV60644.1 alpha-2-macroglobulin [Bacteroides sp. 519]
MLFVNYSCEEKTAEDIVPSSEFAAYVNAYTGGVISQGSSIRVELTQDLPVVELNTELKDNPFSFSPSLKGKAFWVSNNTIEFVPEEGALKPGTLYKANFKLGDYVQVTKGLNKFQFTFRVLERNFAMDVDAIHVTASHPEYATVTGNIRFSDAVKQETVDKMISAKIGRSQTLSVTTQQTDNPAIYKFTINNINKEAKESEVRICVNGKVIGVDTEICKTLLIPAKDTFTYLAAERIQQPENGIQIVFSEALSKTQNLNGLIQVYGASSPVLQVEDNKVNVFYENSRNDINIDIHQGIKSATGKTLKTKTSVSFSQEYIKPEVSWVNNTGTIMPDSKKLIVNFKAVSLYAVDLSVVRIFENNVLSFLQTNALSGSEEIRRSGRLVYKKMLRLDNDPTKDLNNWEEYSIDLSGVIEQEPGAIYRLMISFKQDYSAYPCDGEGKKQLSDNGTQMTRIAPDSEELDDSDWDTPYAYYYMEGADYDWHLYDWEESDNPCHPSYYMGSDRKISCNVLATNLGVIAKQNSANKLWVAVSNILDTSSVPSADVIAYNFQLQPIGNGKTDSNGFVEIECKGVPFALVASLGKQKTYLKLIDGEDLSVSRFDVGGKEIAKGLKGFIYGERGVWRPGDTLHISFMLEDAQNRIPDKHPVSFELYNPRGQFYTKMISANGINGLYTFQVPTKQDDPTGMWNGYVKVGGASFHKSFRIETVKPNRLKINLTIPDNIVKASNIDAGVKLSSTWLTGATASSLAAKVEMSLSRTAIQFKDYSQYIFNNPATDFNTEKMDVFDGKLDSQGDAFFRIKLPNASNAPGMLQANITTRVFEPGGDASINTVSVPFSPFSSYVGINLNQSKSRYIETDKDHVFDIVTVDPTGKLMDRSNLEYRVYRINWSWWWEKRNESFSSYINNSSMVPEAQGTISTKNGKGQFSFRVNYPSWGRYLVYVKDRISGHATGGTIYIDWPDWRGRSNKSDPSGVTMLSFSVDKENYNVGETVTTIIPASAGGRALVTLETGSVVLHREWITVSEKDDTKYQFKVTPEMAPNVYLHIMLLQPHEQTVNDLPIRMYGVVPVFVTNKATVLEPRIKMPDVLTPENEFTVTVDEKDGKPMTYTLAIVDDGLLDLTNFKTPDPWNHFYAREALGIRTWDMFDDVIGAYAGSYSSLFSTGGDEMLKQDDAKANRFRPVVKFLGPFKLDKGKKNTHKITLPMYVGSVRTMIVAGQDGAYGRSEKTTPVRTPLMLLSTLPRVLSIGEEILLPVNVFAMEDGIKNVSVNIETTPNVQLTDGNKKSVTFSKAGDQLVYFRLKSGDVTGIAKIDITATSGKHSTKESIEIDVRNPNPVVTLNESKLLGAGETGNLSYKLGNASKESWLKLEVSRIPSVDISRRFDYLHNYQHYCSEQLTSRALPLLFVSQFKETDTKEKENIKKNVLEAIKHLYSRQLSNGGIVYWPGNSSANQWITSYSGMFLVMAKEKGYEVNSSVLNKWKSYQRNAAKNWSPVANDGKWYYRQDDLEQAYRLYTLALAGSPELGAMNRLKEKADMSIQTRWRLAAAYALIGQTEAANNLIFNVATTVEDYPSNNYVYGSSSRDEAMILEALVLMGRDKEAFEQAKKVSRNLNRENYFSTQSTAYSLMAMGRLAEKLSGSFAFEWKLNGGNKSDIKSTKAIYQNDLPLNPLSGSVELKNKGEGAIYVDLVSRTQLLNDTLPAMANNLKVEVRYTDMSGNPTDITNLKQGTDFMAVVTVSNINATIDYKDIALTHIIPSGWEIYNERMIVDDSAEITEEVKQDNYTYRDIRDDRVLTYFDLAKAKSKVFPIRLQATYAGTFTLPAIQCEAMYDVLAQGRTKAGVVTVTQ